VDERSSEARAKEAFVRRFHAERPGIMPAAFARGGTYHRLAALVPAGARVLDLGAGDGYLCGLLAARGARAIGVDFSHEELARFCGKCPGGAAVAARAQALPFADGSFDACICHLALMLMEDAPAVVGELGRVLAPGGRFGAVLGGGPVADADERSDGLHRFLAIAGPRLASPRLGDPRARSEAGWRELFAGWTELGWERWEVDLGGSLEEVWRFLGSTYNLSREDVEAVHPEVAAALAELAGADGRVPCRMVTWLGTARRPGSRR
jgi:SAM-dependent methyltransferase